ncbi:MAG: PucR family transcriptional regulator ligand-binding domain-containing protein [Firmicutes bacterium]|nr:PucR family transcriptional regulator ligand-binding domain-containing protein [Bacillota bacterium]
MAVTVSNILDLPSFKNASVLAGNSALDTPVHQVSISDSPLTEIDNEISRPGDFYLSEFYFAKNSEEDMITYLEPIIKAGGSGICIIDEFVKELPPSVIEYCNKNDFPVILNSVSIPYAVMIREIMEMIIMEGQNTLLANGIYSIIEGTIDINSQMRVMNNINPNFHSSITVFYVTMKDPGKSLNDTRDLFNRDISSSGIIFRSGVFGIISHSTADKADPQIKYYIEKLKSCNNIRSIGISDPAIRMKDVSIAFNQAIAAADFSSPDVDIVSHYKDLGIARLIMLLSGHPELEKFCSDIIGTLQEYDQQHNSQLFETMCIYRQCGYQHKDAAKLLFVHENTIRYRISKAKEIITEKAPRDDFRETFSLALKCQYILDRYK